MAYIDKITNKDTGESRPISPAADKVRVDNENYEGTDLDEVLDEIAEAIEEAGGEGGYTPPQGGIPKTDLAHAVQTSLDKADTAYQKPASGIPATDIADGVIPDVSGFATKTEVDDAIDDALDGFTPADVPTKVSDLTNDAGYQTQQQVAAAISQAAIEAVVGNGDFVMTYDESTDTYNIVRLVPTITVSDDSLAFDYTSKTKTITVSGTNLKADIAITVPSGWTASVNSLAQVDGVVAETQVTLTYGGADASTASGDLVLTAGAATVSVPLSYAQYGGPTITVDPATLSFEAIGNQSQTKTATVGKFNIEGELSVSVSGTDSGKFSASLSGSTLSVTYTPGNINSGNHTATITLSASGATDKTVAVSGSVLAQSLTINPVSLDFSGAAGTATSAKQIVLTGANLQSDVTVTPPSSGFTVTRNGNAVSTIAKEDVMASGGVTLDVVAAGTTASGSLTFASGLASASTALSWHETEAEDVGVVVTRLHGYASDDATSPTIGIKFRITELPSGGGHGKAMVVNSLGKCGYYTGLVASGQKINYNGMYRAHVPATISINGNIYDVTELGGGCFCYCESINYISFEEPSSLKSFKDNKDSDAIGSNMTAFSNSANFKGTRTVDSAHIMKIPYGVTSVKTNAGGQTMVSHIYAPDTLTGFYPLGTMPNVTFIDLGSGVTDLGSYAIRYTAVRTLILRSATKVALYNNTSVNNWPNGVTVYVPSALISAYESDANWAAGSDKITFAALEGSEYETSIYNN